MFFDDDVCYRLFCNNQPRCCSGHVREEKTKVVVEHFVQPDKPENLDVLFVIDTSCSMSDNFENVSIGLDLLRDDMRLLLMIIR